MPYSLKPNLKPRNEDNDDEEDIIEEEKYQEEDGLLPYSRRGKLLGNIVILIILAGMGMYLLHYLQYATAIQTFSVISPDGHYRAEGYAYRLSLNKILFHTNDDSYVSGFYRLYSENEFLLAEINVNTADLQPRFQNNNAIFQTNDGYLSIPLRRRIN